MRLRFLSILFLFSSPALFAQSRVHQALKKELDSMYVLDQQYRALLGPMSPIVSDSLVRVFGVRKEALPMHLWSLQQRIDSGNIIRAEQIMKEHGYPGKSLVGTPTNEAMYYIIQHSEVIGRYLPAVKEAAEKGELPFRLYATMLDRSLMYAGKEQEYGTQGTGFEGINPETGRKERLSFIWPIRDAAAVNGRRKKAGFEQTVEENAKRLGIPYKAYTLDDVKRMKGTQ